MLPSTQGAALGWQIAGLLSPLRYESGKAERQAAQSAPVSPLEACSIACGACFLTLQSIALHPPKQAITAYGAMLCIMQTTLPSSTEWCSERKKSLSPDPSPAGRGVTSPQPPSTCRDGLFLRRKNSQPTLNSKLENQPSAQAPVTASPLGGIKGGLLIL